MTDTWPPMHGGDLRAASRRYRIAEHRWLDLSTGMNPHAYPVPDIPRECWEKLPNDAQTLQREASHFYDCESLVLIPGSQWAIHHLPALLENHLATPARVLVPRIGYSEHARAWARSGAQVQRYTCLPDVATLQGADVCVVINPHNPLGTLYTRPSLDAFLARARAANCLLVVDEAFMDASPQHSLMPLADKHGLLVLRSFGKFFGLAGVRLGAISTSESLLQQCREQLPIWSLAGPACHVGACAMQDFAWHLKMRLRLQAESNELGAALAALEMGKVQGCSLFQTLDMADSQAACEVFELLAKQGVLIRHIADTGLLRIGLPGGNAERARLLSALAQARGAARLSATTHTQNNKAVREKI